VVHLAAVDGGVERVAAPFIASPFAGEPAEITLNGARNLVFSPAWYHSDIARPVLFDYDADGRAEIVFTMVAWVNEGPAGGAVGRVFTFEDGAARAYGPAANLEWQSAEDIDDDQRPDLIGHYFGVPIAAHSLRDGTFSWADAAAQAYAARACPPTRRSVFIRVPDMEQPSGYGNTGWNGPCARLWGASSERVLQEIDRHCGRGAQPRCSVKSALTDDVTESAETYRRDARVAPPVVLHAL
jgi:hypothetical protein